jgi:hypothetical protein
LKRGVRASLLARLTCEGTSRRVLAAGFAAGIALMTLGLVNPPAAHAVVVRKALINGDTVIDSSDQPGKSDEQIQAEANGFTVTVVDGTTWDAMSETDFRAYDELIIGDPSCSIVADSVMTNVDTWTKAVMDSGGNRFTIGSDPVFHSGGDSTNDRNHIIKDGIAFVGAQAGATGAYVDTTCDASTNNTTILNDLSLSHSGWTVEEPFCAGNIGIVATIAGFTTTDADLSDWSCSSHSDYPSWANDWVPYAISADAPTQNYCANDIETKLQVCGEPYILVAGSGIVVSSDISLSPPSATNPMGTDHTVTATVTKNGTPEAGKIVTFTISVGPNAGKTGSGVTDANGHASFTYHDDGGLGTDTIVAEFTDDSARVQQATASKTWVEPEPTTTTTTEAPTTTTTDAPTTTTSTSTTTTTAAPTTTTSTSTTTTSTTTTTVAPTTTTTTTTVAPTTTTTTTTVAPTTTTTTTTATSSTTTATAPTTTSTTTVPLTSTSTTSTTLPVTGECKPGYGHGDRNHCHSGPPAHDLHSASFISRLITNHSGTRGIALFAGLALLLTSLALAIPTIRGRRS